jgi:uncharacterized protein (TIRG00374 family)
MKAIKVIILISIVFSFCLFINTTDVGKAISLLRIFGANFIILLLTTFVAYLLGAIGWKLCLGADGKKLLLGDLFIIRHVGETVTFLNPAGVIGGEAVKVYLLNNKGVEKKTVITSVFVSRIVMVITQIMLFLFAVYFYNKRWHRYYFSLP